ncbi:hypothetical protein CLU79DRAFT_699435 [Phycomyces nitens]|nr:hypothetical protein CLU79DRAFT_699435 [Phycomyces nitens]
MYSRSYREKVSSATQKRRQERMVRWQDSPRNIATSNGPICFIPTEWMNMWEQYIEGCQTEYPPAIDLNQWYLPNGYLRPNIVFNPFAPNTTDITLISWDTWTYLKDNYPTLGTLLTESEYWDRMTIKLTH